MRKARSPGPCNGDSVGFELAKWGTIFLDEVGELSSDTQVAFAAGPAGTEFERVGGREPIRVDVRVIAGNQS